MASVITIIITTISSLILFENILLKESHKREKLMLNAIIRVSGYLKPKYKKKLQNALYKIRTMLMLLPKSHYKSRGKLTFSFASSNISIYFNKNINNFLSI